MHLQKSSSSSSRVGLINNPSDQPTEDNSGLYRAIWASFLTQSIKNALDFTLKLLKEDTVQLLTQGTKMKDLLLKVSSAASSPLFETTQLIQFIFTCKIWKVLFCYSALYLSFFNLDLFFLPLPPIYSVCNHSSVWTLADCAQFTFDEL